jgi:tRNA threonylcarbamoyladenosine biosynthesis protein TsaB
MPESQSFAGRLAGDGALVLGVDTCGPAGSVALARIDGKKARILRQKELAGRSYSATLIASVGDLLAEQGEKLASVGAIVVVNGPGSFTGVRVGLSAVKGLAEPAQIPVIAVSRLAVLAAKAGVVSAALDAHRQEVFLRIAGPDGHVEESLAGVEELAGSDLPPTRLAVCDEAAAALLASTWAGTELVRCEAPTAAEAIEFGLPGILRGDFADLATLDGHYLRRSDAEIFGDAPKAAVAKRRGITLRRMTDSDLDRVMDLAAATQHAPRWGREAWERALQPDHQPRRVALVAEAGETGTLAGFAVASVMAPEAELESIVTASAQQRSGVGRELIKALKNELRHQEVREIILEVRAGNAPAAGFYRFLGFAEEGRRPAYYADPEEDGILMRLRIA